jgi:hypothetical protein
MSAATTQRDPCSTSDSLEGLTARGSGRSRDRSYKNRSMSFRECLSSANRSRTR